LLHAVNRVLRFAPAVRTQSIGRVCRKPEKKVGLLAYITATERSFRVATGGLDARELS